MKTKHMPAAPAHRTVLAACLAGLMQGAWAADAGPVESITVVGQAARIRSALDLQQADDAIVSVVHADAIGALPDTNAAEALQRVPGVSVERDQGEGRYIRVRGLGPDFNSVTINGSLVPSPESERRAVMLDVIPSALIRALEVRKTLSPEQDANSLGGTVEVKTLSAFDQPGRLLSIEAEAHRDQHTGKTSPKLAATWADRFADGRLGLALGLNWEKRKFGSANIETGGSWDFADDGAALLEEFERRDYLITRERMGAAFNLDFKPAAGERYYLRTLLSRYSDSEERQAHVIEFDDAQAEGEAGDAEAARELKSRKETQKIESLTVGTERRLGDWKLQLAAAASRAGEDTPDEISGAVFAGTDDFADVGFRDSRRPALSGPAALMDAAAYQLDEIELTRSKTRDTERNLRLDLGRDLAVGDAVLKLKFGGKLSRREKTVDEDVWQFEDLDEAGFDDEQLSLANFSRGNTDWKLGAFGPRIDADAVRRLMNGLPRADYANEEDSRVNDFNIREDIDAAYLQGTLSDGPWRLLAGVRYEGTRRRADGTGLDDGDFVASHTEHKDRHWLPALHLRHDFDDATSLRAAWTHSVVRPTFGQLAPGFVIDGDEASFGNPALEALKSRNLDLGIEHRIGPSGTLSAYVFDKDIKNFVYQTDLAGSGRWMDFDEAVTFANGDKARLHGLELNYTQQLRSLPAPWNGLILIANGTWTRSRASIGRFDADAGRTLNRDIPLPSQSNRSGNLALGYEADPLSLRLAANYKSAYLLEVGDLLDARHDLYVDAQTQIDFSARYMLTRQVQLSFEALNLRDEPYYVYTGSARHNAQYETYGRSFKVGLKFSLY
ncbi:TonB-dependent receptor [Chitinimonas koreensis]|uniref:TonB-dependent receptor n=1 Tax=Chitinimonas koreensis TaxID=356302 RepID=UPI000550073B|nr:TonB-dependent receptor [Chitinimonas koreensis]QNM98371.1 TonB-dependent receptor [Chitinimonas koreensis]